MARRWNSVFTVNDQNPVPHLHPIPVQEPGCGARHSLQRCRKQGAVYAVDGKGAASRDHCTPNGKTRSPCIQLHSAHAPVGRVTLGGAELWAFVVGRADRQSLPRS